MNPQAWITWQLADSAFPSGGFAHSMGLEAAWKHGSVSGDAEFQAFLRTSLTQQARASLPLALGVWDQPADLPRIDELADALLTSHVAHRASRALGRALLSAAAQVFPDAGLADADTRCRTGQTPGHLAPVFGLVCRRLDIPREQAVDLMMFQHARAILSAAVRLGIVGPIRGQQVLHAIIPLAQRLAHESLGLSPDDCRQTAPLLELMQANQDRIYSRLFQS